MLIIMVMLKQAPLNPPSFHHSKISTYADILSNIVIYEAVYCTGAPTEGCCLQQD